MRALAVPMGCPNPSAVRTEGRPAALGNYWLTFGNITDGVVHFSLTANSTTAARTAHITLLGQQIAVTQSGLDTQEILFGTLSSQVLGIAPLTVSAKASSGLAVTIASTTAAVCTVTGSTVTLVSVGTCTIQATQSGDARYAAATPVSQSFEVTSPSGLCDINRDGSANAADVQKIVSEALGIQSGSNDLTGDGTVNVMDVQIVVNAASGLGCTVRLGSNLVAFVK